MLSPPSGKKFCALPLVFQLASFCPQHPLAWLTQHWPLSSMSHLLGVRLHASASAAPCCSLWVAGLSLGWCTEGLCPFVQGMTDRQSWLSALGSMTGSWVGQGWENWRLRAVQSPLDLTAPCPRPARAVQVEELWPEGLGPALQPWPLPHHPTQAVVPGEVDSRRSPLGHGQQQLSPGVLPGSW
uniref:Uncharacterized protein n=1 Tax=Molossus molossus TaxID=27622 RepID=A0A7J8DQ56_MOLMO|nr:hypothetical protein HJG59_009294 [Molossus molossus]